MSNTIAVIAAPTANISVFIAEFNALFLGLVLRLGLGLGLGLDLQITIKKGEKTGICGKNGSLA